MTTSRDDADAKRPGRSTAAISFLSAPRRLLARPEPADAPDGSHERAAAWRALRIVLVGAFMAVLDTFIVLVADAFRFAESAERGNVRLGAYAREISPFSRIDSAAMTFLSAHR